MNWVWTMNYLFRHFNSWWYGRVNMDDLFKLLCRGGGDGILIAWCP